MSEHADDCLGEVLDPYWGPAFDLFPHQEVFLRSVGVMTKDNKNDGSRVITPIARLSFPHLFEKAPAIEGNSEDTRRYSCNLIFPEGTDLSALEAAIEVVKQKKWPSGKIPRFKHAALKDPGHDDYKDYLKFDGYAAGRIFITAKTKDKPGVVGGQFKENITDESLIYPGCWVKASVTAFGYDMPQNKGVSWALNNVWKIRDGESFAGRVAADQDFGDEELDPEAFGEEDLAESLL